MHEVQPHRVILTLAPLVHIIRGAGINSVDVYTTSIHYGKVNQLIPGMDIYVRAVYTRYVFLPIILIESAYGTY